MKSETLHSESNRRLSIDFDLYTDGDADFKSELIISMIDNLEELTQSLENAVELGAPDFFNKVCHKIKPTIAMLEDNELTQLIDIAKVQLSRNEDTMEVTKNLKSICQLVINNLVIEMKQQA